MGEEASLSLRNKNVCMFKLNKKEYLVINLVYFSYHIIFLVPLLKYNKFFSWYIYTLMKKLPFISKGYFPGN